MDVLPFTRPLIGDELPPAQPAELARAELPLAFVQVLPQGQVRQEIRAPVVETGMQRRRHLPFLRRPFPGVLDRKAGGDHQHLVEAPEPGRLQHHAPEARVQRHLGQLAPDLGEAPAGGAGRPRLVSPGARRLPSAKRAQLLQKGYAVFHIALVRRVHKGKIFDLPEAYGRHLQDHRRQVGAQDFRLGERAPGIEVLFRIEPDADTGPRRPQRPARWLAEACEMASMGNRCTLVRRL